MHVRKVTVLIGAEKAKADKLADERLAKGKAVGDLSDECPEGCSLRKYASIVKDRVVHEWKAKLPAGRKYGGRATHSKTINPERGMDEDACIAECKLWLMSAMDD